MNITLNMVRVITQSLLQCATWHSCLPRMLRSKGLKGTMCTGLLVWRMLVADWKLSVLSVHKGLTPLAPGMCDRWYSARPRLVYRARGEGRASKGALKQLRDKGNSLQERCGSYKSWIENQVRLKAQLQEIQGVYIQTSPCAKDRT